MILPKNLALWVLAVPFMEQEPGMSSEYDEWGRASI